LKKIPAGGDSFADDWLFSFSYSAIHWAENRFPVVSQDQLAHRLGICQACEFWDQTGFGGTGRCSKCGCSTQAKLRMATSSCPVDKWTSIDPVLILN